MRSRITLLILGVLFISQSAYAQSIPGAPDLAKGSNVTVGSNQSQASAIVDDNRNTAWTSTKNTGYGNPDPVLVTLNQVKHPIQIIIKLPISSGYPTEEVQEEMNISYVATAGNVVPLRTGVQSFHECKTGTRLASCTLNIPLNPSPEMKAIKVEPSRRFFTKADGTQELQPHVQLGEVAAY